MAIGRTFMESPHDFDAVHWDHELFRGTPLVWSPAFRRFGPAKAGTPNGRFKESLPKCLRSLKIGRSGLGGDGKPWRISTEVNGDRDILPREVISRKLSVPNAERVFFIRDALRAGFIIEEIFGLSKIDRWFLVQIKEIVDFEEELVMLKN